MARPKKALVKTGGSMSQLIAALKSKHGNDPSALKGLDTANNLAANWRYLDFIDPKTGMPCLLMEWLFGCRGLLSGRMMKIEADQGVGKSSLLFAFYGMFQQTCNAFCFHEEGENAPQPPDYIVSMGCDPNELAIQQPGSIERCMAQIEQMTINVRQVDPDMKSPVVFGVDSVSGFGSDAELDDPGDPSVLDLTRQNAGLGAHARCLSKWFRDRGGVWMLDNHVLIFMVAQLKDKIITTPGAANLPAEMKQGTLAEKPLNFHASYRIILKTQKLYDKDSKDKRDIGELVHIKTIKNKLSPKNREIQIPLIREHGFDFTEETVNMLRRFSPITLPSGDKFIIEQKGAWLEYNGQKYQSNSTGKYDLLTGIYEDASLLAGLREALRIRGFGFDFETKYTPSASEVEDSET